MKTEQRPNPTPAASGELSDRELERVVGGKEPRVVQQVVSVGGGRGKASVSRRRRR